MSSSPAPSGPGAETAHHLVKEGTTTVLVARLPDRLTALTDGFGLREAVAFKVDVPDREQVKVRGRIDVRVNNAGLMRTLFLLT